MKIGFASYKGGVGKTALSYSLARDLGYKYITNDRSIVLSIFKNSKYMPKKMQLQDNTVYDLGGFKNEFASEIIPELDIIFVPVTFDSNAILKTKEFFQEFGDCNIVLIANMVENDKTKKSLKKILETHFKDKKVFFFRSSKLLKNAIESGSSAKVVYNSNNSTKYLYRKAYKDYSSILEFIQNY